MTTETILRSKYSKDLYFLQNKNEDNPRKKFTIVNVHLTNERASDRYEELEEIEDNIAATKVSGVIIAGDFNTGAGTLKPDAENAFHDTEKTMEIL